MLIAVIGALSVVLLKSDDRMKRTEQVPTETSQTSPKPQQQEVSIPTNPVQPVNIQAAVAEAQQSAQAYDSRQKNNTTAYPWLRKLPLAADNYYVYFDLSEKKFIGKLYPKPPENIEVTKQLISAKLKEKQIPYETYGIEWSVFSR